MMNINKLQFVYTQRDPYSENSIDKMLKDLTPFGKGGTKKKQHGRQQPTAYIHHVGRNKMAHSPSHGLSFLTCKS